MYLDSTASPRETATADGKNDRAEGLMLLRASMLKLIRLQLAIERHDRQVALEAVDELVILDRKLEHYLKEAPATAEGLMLRRALDSDRAALNEEKLTLAAEVLRRPHNLEGATTSCEAGPLETGDDDWLGPRDLQIEPEEPRRSRRWLVVVSAVVVAATATAAGTYFIAMPDVAAAWLAEAAGALR